MTKRTSAGKNCIVSVYDGRVRKISGVNKVNFNYGETEAGENPCGVLQERQHSNLLGRRWEKEKK